jgi:leucyl aminopeptidase
MIKNYKPEYIVDIATGSSVGTLGYECGALFTNNEALLKLQDAGDSVSAYGNYRFGMSINKI